ncbi:CyP450 monooxygenase [Earliella scabrosa]|nr:CyP450 monooxygenase [Earliella scabrosa]
MSIVPQLQYLLLPCLALALYGAVRVLRWRRRSRGRPLPPGPKSWPFVGNLSLMRTPEIWKAYRELCATYGDMVHFKVLGQNMVVLGSHRAISEVLEKRSASTSSRPESVTFELVGQDGNFAIQPYGPPWRRRRRAFWQHFLPAAADEYQHTERMIAQKFLRKLLLDPGQFCNHIRYTFAGSVVKILYGIDVAPENDRYVAMLDTVLESADAVAPGQCLVEFLPWLRYVPAWVPGAGFRTTFAQWRDMAHGLKDMLVARTKEGMVHGQTSESVVAKLLEKHKGADELVPPEQLSIAKDVGFAAYEAGADTTSSTLKTFFLAMCLYPDVQKRAQAELDAVVGTGRLPDHADRRSLPYVDALVKETIRWQPAAPLALPHVSTEDVEYDGYFIPAGTILFANSWACLHDPETYPDPERFMPERYLRDDKPDPTACDPARFVFGYGRRVCPGRHFADDSLFINIALVLHVFSITPPLDEAGKAITIEPRMTNGFVSHPEDCRCTIKPRSEKARELILVEAS